MNWKRIIIAVIVLVGVLLIPIISGIFYGFDWEVGVWWLLCVAAGLAIVVDQFVIRKRK